MALENAYVAVLPCLILLNQQIMFKPTAMAFENQSVSISNSVSNNSVLYKTSELQQLRHYGSHITVYGISALSQTDCTSVTVITS